MLNKTSKQFKIQFLSEFTKEILRHTDSYIEIKVQETSKKPLPGIKFKDTSKTKEEKKGIKEVVNEKLKRDKKVFEKIPFKKEDWIPSRDIRTFVKREEKKKELKSPFREIRPQFKIPRLVIPEPELPSTVSYITPVPSEKPIEVGKLAPLIRDPLVKTMEIQGPNQPVVVTGMMGRKKTPINLNQNEIQSIIKRFSEEAKIPFEEGFFKAAIGKLSMSAIISESTGSKFIITKINSPLNSLNLREENESLRKYE